MSSISGNADDLALDSASREGLFSDAVAALRAYAETVDKLPVERVANADAIRERLDQFNFDEPMTPADALRLVINDMTDSQTHTSHRRYFGLFNPAPTTMGIVGELLAAGFNPQLAAWTHAPFAVEAERRLVREIGTRFDPSFAYGSFTTGGAEANLTALLCSLVARCPEFSSGGLRALERNPLIYASAAAHHSVVKALRVLGLGTASLRVVPCDPSLGMDVRALRETVVRDREAGSLPLAVVATCGATATGVVERLPEIARVAGDEGLWFHVDAAWGGFAAFVPELRHVLAGIEAADSITFDPHKMLSVPMGAGMLLTKHPDILGRAFSVSTEYMPASSDDDREDPFTHSLQWSRRFIGLKVLLSLAVAGWAGYECALRRQTSLGDLLRSELRRHQWEIVNETPLPVVCFRPATRRSTSAEIARHLVEAGQSWISSVVLPDGRDALRACVTNYRTTRSDVHLLVQELGEG